MHNQFISGNPFINTTYQLLGTIIPNPARAEFVNSTQEKKGVHPSPSVETTTLRGRDTNIHGLSFGFFNQFVIVPCD